MDHHELVALSTHANSRTHLAPCSALHNSAISLFQSSLEFRFKRFGFNDPRPHSIMFDVVRGSWRFKLGRGGGAGCGAEAMQDTSMYDGRRSIQHGAPPVTHFTKGSNRTKTSLMGGAGRLVERIVVQTSIPELAHTYYAYRLGRAGTVPLLLAEVCVCP
ncbi:hypothetical protein BU24DRAFT_102036 [Aaosphaeria arxii CBS 175.79]|uniref:Uncharacterized protein n=1 Tax=Aaosphaeria arxii CBS 175.79 TaxID=1450172 RepID=A0A6A5Y287_9PLEO|nr:uncharacterized protein BU24DRAFT_102036 [Aaosphaeria arxii CBS 175.79]KAF2018684.1 hypothetical protein BU24DRAFT_102036 [Aaosphaeria arxii CBS 175.79]